MDHNTLPALPQKLTLEDRSHLSVTGVEEVESFDENAVILHTSRGILIVRGRELHLRQLTTGGGQVSVDGTVDALVFEESRKDRGFLARLFG